MQRNAVLRKAKQEKSDKRLQLHTNDPLQNLHVAKCTTFVRTIHNIGLNPFYCMYWSAEQGLMYKTAHKQDNDCFITIDATGSIAKKLRLPNGEKSPHLFLYQCMCVSKVGNFPTFQMVSAKQDASTISYFLAEIIRCGSPIPRLVVTDFGKAILIAIARAFANCMDLQHYMQICYNIINKISSSQIPQSYIRLDINHFIGMIAKWDCIRGKAPKVQQFFLRSLGLAYQMENFTEMQNFLKSVLIIALSEEVGQNESSDTLLLSEIHLRKVNKIIKGTNIEDIIENALNQNEQDNFCCNDDEDIVVEGWTTWAETMFLDAQEIAHNSCNGSIINAHYNPEMAKKIKSLINYLPLWTGIMKPYFNCGSQVVTSSFVEAEFAHLKTRAFKNQLPMRVDKFIFSHLEYLEGRLLLTSDQRAFNRDVSHHINNTDAVMFPSQKQISNETKTEIETEATKLNKLETNSENIQTETIKVTEQNEMCDSLNEIENWRAKVNKNTSVIHNEKKPKKGKATYLSQCPDWDLLTTNKEIGIPL